MTVTSILDGADAAIDRWLGVARPGRPGRYRLREVARVLRGGPLRRRDGSRLISVLLCTVARNFAEARYDGVWEPCRGNWRLRRQRIPPREPPGHPEVTLERRIVRLRPGRWWNQIATAGGLCGPGSDRRRCIDLVHRGSDPGEYTFYELKWATGTPLHAAMEILQYGVLHIFTRSVIPSAPDLFGDRGLLSARKVHLRTLAPWPFYEDADLLWLQESISNGLGRFHDEEATLPLSMDFAFEAFPPDLPRCEHPSEISWQTLAISIDEIRSVYGMPLTPGA